MSGNQAAFQFIRSADMTLPAGSVTLLAVIFKRRIQRGTFFHIAAPGYKSGLEAAECGMEANRIHMGDVLVAGVAVAIGRVDNQTRVGQFFIIVPAVAAVADNTAYLTVGTLQELGILDEDLFPYLQRR